MEKESWETKAFELVNKYDVATKILNTNITISPKHLKTIFKTIRQGVETMNPIDDEEKEKIRTQAKKEVFDDIAKKKIVCNDEKCTAACCVSFREIKKRHLSIK